MLHSPRLRSVLILASFVLTSVCAPAQQNWRRANPLPAAVGWKGVAFGNGVYVIVGQDATIATSAGTITWTIRRMSTAGMALNAIAFADGRFVAVGLGTPTATGGGLIMTSTDGIDWSINDPIGSSVNAQFSDVVFGGGTWLVNGAGGNRMFASTDGLNWTARTVPTAMVSGTYGNGLFVFTNGNNTVTYGSDGANWTRVPVAGTIGASTPFIVDVAFANGKFAAIGRDNNFNALAYTSTDGATWTAAPTIPSGTNGLAFIAATGATFVAAGNAGIYTSTGGAAWTQRPSALPTVQRSLGPITQGAIATATANNRLFVLGGAAPSPRQPMARRGRSAPPARLTISAG